MYRKVAEIAGAYKAYMIVTVQILYETPADLPKGTVTLVFCLMKFSHSMRQKGCHVMVVTQVMHLGQND